MGLSKETLTEMSKLL